MAGVRLVSLRDYGYVKDFPDVSPEDAKSMINTALDAFYAFGTSESFMHDGAWVTVYVGDGDYFAFSESPGYGVADLEAYKAAHKKRLAELVD